MRAALQGFVSVNPSAPLSCGNCGARLDKLHPEGVQLRTRGILVKGGQIRLICPKCKHDVTPSKAVRDQLILFLKHPATT